MFCKHNSHVNDVITKVRDYFRPTENSTYCEMLQADNKHQWSPNGVDWVEIEFDRDAFNGGSAANWPVYKGRAGDARAYLSFWGDDHASLTGGCCSSSTAVVTTHPSIPGNVWSHWGQPCT